MSSPPVALARLDHAVRLLAQCRTLDEVSHIRAMAQAAEEYARAEKLGEEAVRYATEIRVRAARKAGEMLRDMAASGERPLGRPEKESATTTLSDLGVSRDQSSRWQAIAALPAEEFEAAIAAPEPLSETRLAGAHVSNNSGENEWYTPAEYITAASAVMGGIDLDPASTPVANDAIGAALFYTKADDGLRFDWKGRVWMNPPYAQPLIEQFCTKLAEEHAADNVEQACALTNNATETGWFQTLAAAGSAMCFPRGRVKFWHPERVSAPLQGQAIVYLGSDTARFREVFSPFGFTVAL